MANTPNYLGLQGVAEAIARINNPGTYAVPDAVSGGINDIDYEHYVSSFAFTIAKHVFHDPKWVITPEKKDVFSGKMPDMTIEQVTTNTFQTHVAFELKKRMGQRFEEALNQVINAVKQTIGRKGDRNDSKYEVFIVVQRGLDIGFFEYHHDTDNLDSDEVQHFRGVTSLTQTINNQAPVIPEHNSMEHLFYDTGSLKEEIESAETNELRAEADAYQPRCVLNLLRHKQQINSLFHHMSTNEPRSS